MQADNAASEPERNLVGGAFDAEVSPPPFDSDREESAERAERSAASEDRSFIVELLVVTEDGMSREEANELGVKLAVWLDLRKGVANTIFSEVRGADD